MADYRIFNTYAIEADDTTLRVVFENKNPVDRILREVEVFVSNSNTLQEVYDSLAEKINSQNTKLDIENKNVIIEAFGTVDKKKSAVNFSSTVGD